MRGGGEGRRGEEGRGGGEGRGDGDKSEGRGGRGKVKCVLEMSDVAR